MSKTRLPRATLLLILVATLPLLAGCSSSSTPRQAPVESAIALEKSFRLAVDGINVAYCNGHLQIEDKRALSPYVNEGNQILEDLWAKTEDGTKALSAADFGDVASRMAVKIEKLLRARADADKAAAARPRPATRPAPAVPVPAGPPADDAPVAPPLPQ